MTGTRLVAVDDAPALAELVVANREYLAPWDPPYPEGHFTEAGQRETIEFLLDGHAGGTVLPLVILDGRRIVGRITLSHIVRGSMQSGVAGYWVARDDAGRGHATAALQTLCAIAFSELALHRVEAGTLVHNAASQTVLGRCGFRRYGLAPKLLYIAGRWQDHLLFQRLADD